MDRILTVALPTGSDPQSGFGVRSSSEVERQFRDVRKHVDSLIHIAESLEQQLERSRLRNKTLTDSLREARLLLEADHQTQAGGRPPTV